MRMCQPVRAQNTYLRGFGLLDHFVETLVFLGISVNEILEVRKDGIKGPGLGIRAPLQEHVLKPTHQLLRRWKPFITDWSRHAVGHKYLTVSPSNLEYELTMCCEMWQES